MKIKRDCRRGTPPGSGESQQCQQVMTEIVERSDQAVEGVMARFQTFGNELNLGFRNVFCIVSRLKGSIVFIGEFLRGNIMSYAIKCRNYKLDMMKE
jgi:hypoxanthine-guanine phosphoribosyltransferase